MNTYKFKIHRFNSRIRYNLIEVFQTNVDDSQSADQILLDLYDTLPTHRFSFDLEDRQRILRVETANEPVQIQRVIRVVQYREKEIEILKD